MGAQRILIVKPSSFGDIVHSLPLLDALRRNRPDAHVAWLVAPAFKDLLLGHPMIDEVLLFERSRWGGPKALLRLRELGAFVRRLQTSRFDLVVDLQGLLRSGLFARLSGAPERVGFANGRELSPLFYTHKIAVDDPEMHAVDRYLLVAKALGWTVDDVRFPVHVGDDARAFADEALRESASGRPLVVMLPATRWETKRWPAKHFAALGDRVVNDLGGTVLLLGATGDRELAGRIVLAMRSSCVDRVGKTSLRQSAALMERADVVVANDSGPMHLAVALGRPTVALFGPTRPGRTGPYGRNVVVIQKDLPCGPCLDRRCRLEKIECMQSITPEEVMGAVEKLLSLRSSPPPRPPRG